MKQSLTTVLMLSVALTVSGAAVAQPVEVMSDGADATPNGEAYAEWSGLYVGGQVGSADGQVTFDPNDFEIDGSGGLYGIHIGYNHDYGDFIVGVEADYDVTNIDIGKPSELGGGTIMDSVARLKLRAGYDLGQTLVYGTAGVAKVWFDESTDPNPNNSSFSENGHFIGVGLSFRATDTLTVSGELLHTTVNDLDGTDDLDANVTTITLRASYNF